MTSVTKVRSIVAAIERLYPKALADSSWDNTGLLVDASSPVAEESKDVSVLLTVDLTESVASEAIANKANLVLAYHPFIFRGLKSITPNDPQQRSLLRLIQNGISVYCPHTAVDAAKGGVNDWLAQCVSTDSKVKATSVLEPSKAGGEGEGMGRLVTFAEPVSLDTVAKRVKEALKMSTILVAPASALTKTDNKIRTVAICAGSGSGVFRGVKADLYFTGELSHHEALHLRENGSSVIACNHSNTERGYLPIMAEKLASELKDYDISIKISQTDKDPYEFW